MRKLIVLIPKISQLIDSDQPVWAAESKHWAYPENEFVRWNLAYSKLNCINRFTQHVEYSYDMYLRKLKDKNE
jgi:hypothetical protein